jgi:hypothetical protein
MITSLRHRTPYVTALVATLLTLAACGSATPIRASYASSVRCRPGPGTRTIAHSQNARIFSDSRTGNDYACLYRNGHPRLLSTTEHWEYRMPRFSGNYVAFLALANGANAYIGAMNLTNGRLLKIQEQKQAAPVNPPPSECPSAVPRCTVTCPQVESLVLKPDGAVAWIAVNFPPPAKPGQVFRGCGSRFPTTTEVRTHDRGGLRVLGHGNGIVPTSLRLSRAKLEWIEDGRTVSTALL